MIATINTACYQSLTLDYRYQAYNLDSGERLYVQWRPGTSGTWQDLANYGNASNWTYPTHNLGSPGTSQIQIRFYVVANQNNEEADIDDIEVSGQSISNGSIGNFVYDTSNNSPISGRTVELWNDNNNNGVIDGGDSQRATTTTTNSPGANYGFTGLPAGNYVVRALGGTGYVPVNQIHDVPTLGCTQNYGSADFGFQRTATINGRVWYDDDRDTVQTGDTGINSVTVELRQGATLVDSKSTDTNGNFSFDTVVAGTYNVQVVVGTLPAGRTFLTSGTNPANVTVTSGGTQSVYWGYDDTGQIGNLIWNDTNGNGNFDSEPGLNWQVSLTDQNGITTNQTASAAGAYNFVGLPAGLYTVTVSIPGGWAQTNLVEHPLPVPLSTGQNYNLARFGFNQTSASISGYVWYDPNRNGVRDPGETTGLNAIGVILRRGTTVVGSVNSNANGYYFFGGLAAGDYQVDVDQADADLGIYVSTSADPLSVSGVVAGQSYPNRNFGFAEPPQVVKPLYLHRSNGLDRNRPTGSHTTAQINDGANLTWTQGLTMAGSLQLTSDPIVVWLYMDPTSGFSGFWTQRQPSATVTLRYGSTVIGTAQQINNLSGGGQWYSFSFNHAASLASGNSFSVQVGVSNANGGFGGTDGNVVIYYDGYPDYLSRIELPVYSYLQIDEANSGTYDAAYPGGAPSDTFLTADNVHFRVRAADPFGNYDISGATISIPGVITNAAMTRYSPNPDRATAVYQLARTGFTLGNYTYTITVTEGAEGEVTDTYTGNFHVIISDLTDSFKEVRSWPARQIITQTVPGAEIEYTVHISNTGDAAALNVSMVDPIPAHTTYVAGSVVNGVYSPTLNAIIWPGVTPTGTVAARSEQVVTFRVRLDPVLDNGTVIENSAVINDGTNQFARIVRATVNAAPNLTTSSKTVDRTSAEPGDILAYTITLTNTGNMNASASLTDAIPISTTLVEGSLSASSGNASYNAGTRTISWNGTAPGLNVNPGVVNITFRARVDFPLDTGTVITNTAYIDDGFAPNGTTPLTRQVTTTITSEPLIQANSSKVVDEPTASPGSVLHYTIRLVNGGKMNAPTVNLLDSIPAWLTSPSGPG